MQYVVTRCSIDALRPGSSKGALALVYAERVGDRMRGSSELSHGGVVFRECDLNNDIRWDTPMTPSLAHALCVRKAASIYPNDRRVTLSSSKLRNMSGYTWVDIPSNGDVRGANCIATVMTPDGVRLLNFTTRDVYDCDGSCLVAAAIQCNDDPLVPLPSVLASLEASKSTPPKLDFRLASGVMLVACANGVYSVAVQPPAKGLEAVDRRRIMERFFSAVRFISMPPEWGAGGPRRLVVTRPFEDCIVLRAPNRLGARNATELDVIVSVSRNCEVTLARECLSVGPALSSAGSLWNFREYLSGAEMGGSVLLEQPMTGWHRPQFTQRYIVDVFSTEGAPPVGTLHIELETPREVSANCTCDVSYPRLRPARDTETEPSLVEALRRVVQQATSSVSAATVGAGCVKEEDVGEWVDGLSETISSRLNASELFESVISVKVRLECFETEGLWLSGEDGDFKIPKYSLSDAAPAMIVSLAVMAACGFRADFTPWGAGNLTVVVPQREEGSEASDDGRGGATRSARL
jgi:hypothetical protein